MTFDPSPSPICAKCGQDHRGRCAGHISSDREDGRRRGDPCSLPPVRGGTKCWKHGNAKGTKGRAAADARVVSDAALRKVTKRMGELGRRDPPAHAGT